MSHTVSSNSDRNNAITILTSDRPYGCTHCHQTFSCTHNLKSHLATHSTTRPFQCGTCHHYFRRQHDLKRHQKLHTGERPYVCGNCRRSFARLDALNRHLRVEGGTACHSNRKSSNRITRKIEQKLYLSSTADTKPTVADKAKSPSPQPLTSSPLSISSPSFDHASLPPLRASTLHTIPSPPLHSHLDDLSSSKPYRSWTYPDPPILSSSSSSPSSPVLNRILPPPISSTDPHAYQQQIKSLELENAKLKKEIEQLSANRLRFHELEVENNLLRSLITDQRVQAIEYQQKVAAEQEN